MLWLRSEQQVQTAEQILADSSASSWLKNALLTALTRDPIDARHDAYVLSEVLDARALNILDDTLPPDAHRATPTVVAPSTCRLEPTGLIETTTEVFTWALEMVRAIRKTVVGQPVYAYLGGYRESRWEYLTCDFATTEAGHTPLRFNWPDPITTTW